MGGCLSGTGMKDEERLSSDEDPQFHITVDNDPEDEWDDNFKQTEIMYDDYRKASVDLSSRKASQAEIENFKLRTRKISKCVQASVDPERLSMLDIADNLVDYVRRITEVEPKIRHGVYFCQSFGQYLEWRDNVIEPYEVHLEEYNPNWKDDANDVIEKLWEMNCSEQWDAVEHIGSTAVEHLHAKPILDLMITIKSKDREGFESAVDNFLKDQEKSPLPFKIAFTAKTPCSEDDWGFFQVPRNAASGKQMNEVNVHVYAHETNSAREKIIFRDFLNENEEWRNKYTKVKMDLMTQIQDGELSVALYARKKNEIVSKILKKARWRYRLSSKTKQRLEVPNSGGPRGEKLD